jgi:hypothetical protein
MKRKKKRTVWLMAAVGLLIVGGAAGYFVASAMSGQKTKPANPAPAKKAAAPTKTAAGDASQSQANAAPATETREYANSRYGFRFAYPLAWTAQASVNGDGVTLKIPGNDKVSIGAYGYPVDAPSLDQMLTDLINSARQAHPALTYIDKQDILIDNHPALTVTLTYAATADDAPLTGSINRRVILTRKDEVGLVLEMIGEEAAVAGLAADFKAVTAAYVLH